MAERRFIAGAVCPECRALDRIVVETIAGVRRQRCVTCGFERADLPGATAPRSRLESAPDADRQARRVRIVGAGEDRGKEPGPR